MAPTMTIINLLEQDGQSPKYVASTHGGEYHSACPICGGKDRFQCWPNRSDGKKKTWHCRSCDHGGDDIEYLKYFRNMSFPDACKHLGRDMCFVSHDKPTEKIHGKFLPREVKERPDAWHSTSMKYIEWAHKKLLTEKEKGNKHLDRLKALKPETIDHFKLGFSSETFFRSREKWGLDTIMNEKGVPKKLWLPAGIVIPNLHENKVLQIRIRTIEENQRYITILSQSPCFVPCTGDYYIVVESDLDAMLLWQEAKDLVGVVSLGSTLNPDEKTIEKLDNAKGILVSLDSDEAGKKKAAEWIKRFKNSIRWPVHTKYGKDVGDAYKNGMDVISWVEAGLRTLNGTPALKETSISESSTWYMVVYSEVLGENILISPDRSTEDYLYEKYPEIALYDFQELEKIECLGTEQLKVLHEAKKSLGGTIKN